MASLYITEFVEMYGNCPVQPAIAEQVVEITGNSLQSRPFHRNTKYVLLSPDANCSVRFGDDPEALVTSERLWAYSWIPFSVSPGHKVAVISNA